MRNRHMRTQYLRARYTHTRHMLIWHIRTRHMRTRHICSCFFFFFLGGGGGFALYEYFSSFLFLVGWRGWPGIATVAMEPARKWPYGHGGQVREDGEHVWGGTSPRVLVVVLKIYQLWDRCKRYNTSENWDKKWKMRTCYRVRHKENFTLASLALYTR